MTPDPQAQRLTEALRRESPDLLRYFRRRVTEPEDAADLLAETGLTAWRRVRDLPADDEGARRWLFTVAHNTYLNHQRGSRRRHALADRVRRILARAERVSPPSDDGIEVRDQEGDCRAGHGASVAVDRPARRGDSGSGSGVRRVVRAVR